MRPKLLSSVKLTWPMLPLAAVLFIWPWFHRTVVSRNESATSITFCGQLVYTVAFSKESLLTHSDSDDYQFAARGRHLMVGKLLHAMWLALGLLLTVALVSISRQKLNHDSADVTWPPWRSLLLCFSLGAVVIVLYQATWAKVTGQPFTVRSSEYETSYIFGLGSFVLLVTHPWILAPICEELLFRTWLQRLLTLFAGRWLALAGTAAVFGLLHHVQGWAGMIQITFLAAVSGLLYLKTGRLWVSIALHAMANIGGSAEVVAWLSS